MGNIVDSDRGEAPGYPQWSLAFDCRPGELRPLLVCHSKRVILSPKDVQELVKIANAEQTDSSSKLFDRYGDLPNQSLKRAARVRAAQLLSKERIHVPPDRDAAGIQSVHVSTAIVLFQTPFGKQLIQLMCRTRRVQLDLVGSRVRRALNSNPTPGQRDLLRMKLVIAESEIRKSNYSIGNVTGILKRMAAIADKHVKGRTLTSHASEAMAVEFELLGYGHLASLFVAATSGDEICKSFFSKEDEVAIQCLHSFWEYLKSASVYSSLNHMSISGASALFARTMLAFSACTSSFQSLIQTATVLMLQSLENQQKDIVLPWQAVNSLNSIEAAVASLSSEGERHEDIAVATKSSEIKGSTACMRIINMLGALCRQYNNAHDELIPSILVGFDAASLTSLLELVSRSMSCFFARARVEDCTNCSDGVPSNARAAVLRLQNDLVHSQGLEVAQSLLKIVEIVQVDPTNGNFRKLFLHQISSEISKVPAAIEILNLIGFESVCKPQNPVKTEKKSPQAETGNVFVAKEVNLNLLSEIHRELRQCLKNFWATLLPELLTILNFQLCLVAKHRAFPASSHLRHVDLVRKDLISSLFDDLLRVVGLGFEEYQCSQNAFRRKASSLAIKVICDGIQTFLPKASQQVSFLSRIFDASMPLTPSSIFKRDLSLSTLARKEISDYMFCKSSITIDPSYLTDLAFGQDEDLWSSLVLDIKKEAPDAIAWRRVCRVIADIQVNESDFARYKNDPVVSPILNKIMRAEHNDIAPLKMGTINQALIKLAAPFPDLLDTPQSEQHLTIDSDMSESYSSRFQLAQKSAKLLFCFQRDLFQRSIVDGVKADAHSVHPVLEFCRIFIKIVLQTAEDITDPGSCFTSEHEKKRFRMSLVGSLLPHVLLGLSATLHQFHPESASLRDLTLKLQSLHKMLGNSDGASQNNEENSEQVDECSANLSDYDYSTIENILDGGNAIDDLLIDPIFDLLQKPDNDVPEEDFRTGLREAAKQHMVSLLTSRRASPQLLALFLENHVDVLESLSILQRDNHKLDTILQSDKTLQRIVSEVIFGEPQMDNLFSASRLPSLYMCSMCGETTPTIADLLIHTLGRGKSSITSSCAQFCATTRFDFVRQMTTWVLAKVARKLVSGTVSNLPSIASRADTELLISDSQKKDSGEQWIKSALFKGGFDRSDHAVDDNDEEGAVISVRMTSLTDDGCFFDDLIAGKSLAGMLNNAILSLPEFKAFPHRNSGGDPIAHATRATTAVLIKHGGMTSAVRALANKIAQDQAASAPILLQPSYSAILKLWHVADSLKIHWVSVHQEGIESVCIEPTCRQTVVFDSTSYRCGNGHENSDCFINDKSTYEWIRDSVLSKCNLLLETESASRVALQPTFLRQNSMKVRQLLNRRSPFGRLEDGVSDSPKSPSQQFPKPIQRWGLLRNKFSELGPQFRSMNSPQFHRTINDAVIDFIKSKYVDPRELRRSLESVEICARRKAQGFDIFSDILYQASEQLSVPIAAELACAVREWPVPNDHIAQHFSDRIESAGVVLLGNVHNSYAVLAGRVSQILKKALTKGNDNALVVLLLIEFFKIGYVPGDFVLLRSLKLTDILRSCLATSGQGGCLIASAIRRLLNAISLVSFCHDRPETYCVPKHESRMDAWQLSILDDMLQELSVLWPSPSSPEYARHEYAIFETLSVLLLACHSGDATTPKALDYLRASLPWMNLLVLYWSDGYSMSPTRRQLSLRCFRRVASIACIVFPYVYPEKLAEVYFDGPNVTPMQLIEDLMRVIGQNTCGANVFLIGNYGKSAEVENFTGSERSCLRARCAVRLLRALQAHQAWSPVLSRVVSLHLTLLNSIVPTLEYGKQLSDPQAVLDLVGVLRFLGNFLTPISCGSCVNILQIGGSSTGKPDSRRNAVAVSANSSNTGTVVGIYKSKAIIIRDSDPSLSFIEREFRELEVVSEPLHFGELLLTRQAVNSLLYLISLRPAGSCDRRRSSVDKSGNATSDQEHVFQPSLMFAQLQSFGLKAFMGLLENIPSLVSQDTLSAITASTNFVRNLLQVARMPIPLHEASDLRDLEMRCSHLGMLLHDKFASDQSNFGVKSVDSKQLRDELDEHIDWCSKAVQIFHGEQDWHRKSIEWLKSRRQEVSRAMSYRNQKFAESASPKRQTGDMVTRLSAMGFPVSICEKALQLNRNNETLAANWLMDNGVKEAEKFQINSSSVLTANVTVVDSVEEDAEWAPDGVDFFQEMGDGDVALDLTTRLPSDKLDGNFEEFSDTYNRLALEPNVQQSFRDPDMQIERVKAAVSHQTALKHLSLQLSIDDIRIGQSLRVSKSWVSARERVLGEEGTGVGGSGRSLYHWYLNSVQNTWEPFDDNVTAQLEERWRSGDSFCAAILDSEPFMFRLDRMAMYHSLTGYMVRLRRRRMEKAVSSPFQRVSGQPKDQESPSAAARVEVLTAEEQVNRTMQNFTPAQLATVEQLIAIVPDMSKTWILHGLQKHNFDANMALEWIFANTALLESLDKENAAKLEPVGQQPLPQLETEFCVDDDAESDSFLYNALLDLGGVIGTVIHIDRANARVRLAFPLDSRDFGFCQSENDPGIICPLAALQWPDACVEEDMQAEIQARKRLGVAGLTIDAYVALGIVLARRAVLSMMRLSLSNPVEESADDAVSPSLSLSKLNLKVVDVISILKLVANDVDHINSHGVSIWFLMRALAVHPKYSREMLPFLIEDCLVHLRRSSSRVFETSTAHPYPDSCQIKEEVYIENACELLVEFDRRSHLKEGHAMVSFWSDPECTSEIAIMSGSGYQSPGNPTGSGFRPFIVRSNRFFITFGSGTTRPNGKVEFGFTVRVRPLGYRFEDERDILRAPLGWSLLSLLTSDQLISSCVTHARGPKLIQTLMRYLRCAKSPAKVFATTSLEKLMIEFVKSGDPKDSLLDQIGGRSAIAQLQICRDRIRDVNMRAPVGSSFSPFLKALEDLLRLVRVAFPSVAFQTCDLDGESVNPWEMRVAIGKCTAVDVARVEMVLQRLYAGQRLPSLQVFSLSYEHLNTIQLLRLCLKELETSIKLNKQVTKWKDERRFWMSMVNTFKDVDYLSDILLMLRRSMLDSAFEPMWSIRQKDWETKVREARTLAQYAICLRDLEDSFRWRDEKDDNRESALVTAWRASRPNWLKTVATLSEEGYVAKVQTSIPSAQEADRAPYWTREANEQLVAYLDALISHNARRLRSLTFVDVVEPKPNDLQGLYPALIGVPLAHLRSRFGVLKMINQLVAAIIIPITPLWSMRQESLGTLLRECKKVIFLETKLAILTQSVQRMYSKEKDPQNVVLNRHEAAKERATKPSDASRVLTVSIRHSIFYQLYSQLKLVDSEALRRKGQAWRVKFVGERGHDVGGLFNASLSNICDELMSFRLPLFVPTPNAVHKIGDNREKWIPNPAANDPQHAAWFEFVGKLMGIACLSQNRTLSIDLPSMVWKTIVRESLTLGDLKAVDYSVHRTIQLMRRPEMESITEESFEFVFPDMYFTAPSTNGTEVELVPNGATKLVTWDNRLEYARAIEDFRLHELEMQIGAICRGLAQMLPIDLLSIFSWQQLEVLVCGNPDIDIQLLREKTIYAGNVRESDAHVRMFWRVIESFSASDRREFLQFVWGRSRLPTTKVGFGKDAFKISDHSASILSQNAGGNSYAHDPYLPVAHTCFFALELPRYSSDAIMSERILYAIHNCKTIDADTTQESTMNLNMNWSDGESDDDSENNANADNHENSAEERKTQ